MSVQPASELSGSSIADDVRELRHLEFGRIPDAARLMLVSVRSDVSDLTGVDLSAVRILRGRTEVVLAESRPAMSIVILEPAFFAAAPAQQRYVAVHEMFHAVWTLGSFRFISDFPATAAAYSELLDGLESGGAVAVPCAMGTPAFKSFRRLRGYFCFFTNSAALARDHATLLDSFHAVERPDLDRLREWWAMATDGVRGDGDDLYQRLDFAARLAPDVLRRWGALACPAISRCPPPLGVSGEESEG
jgi:hypothetical protein